MPTRREVRFPQHRAELGPRLECAICQQPIIWDVTRKEWQHARPPAPKGGTDGD